MQLSIQQVANMLSGSNGCLTKAIFSVIGQSIESPEKSLSQAEANAIAVHIDAQHADASPESFREIASMIGGSPVDMSLDARRGCDAAAQAAIQLFNLSGLRTPDAWL